MKKTAPKRSEEEKKRNDGISFPIAGIGASAGGLETLEVFFSHMPPDSGMAFVIIQHLSPQHKSIMASLLAKHTRMTVREIEDGMKVAPNCVYLNPPNKNVAIFNRTLQLMETVKSAAINMPIDFFFRSLSDDQGEKAICIILSGTATDGTSGIKAIKGEGGMAMVQDPATAKYDGMPRSAIDTGIIDFILPVEKMPEALSRYVQHPFIDAPGKIKITEPQIQNHLQKVFSLIRTATGHDFSHYKQSTIRRRIERRLAVHQINKLTDYILYLQKDPKEIHTLFKDLVIGVTSFFRDKEAFKALEQEAIPALLREKESGSPIRLWVVGCSTGEEAYSLGMIVTEALDMLKKHLNVQIFATDIDENALEAARRGIYPESIATDISHDRLNQFFIKENNAYKIKKYIRDMVVFSLQNIVRDPPFSRLDMVSCRNLMIYMDTVLQKKIMPLFHYTLNPQGILFLGTSETIGEYTDLFQPLNFKWKIFKRREGVVDRAIDYSSKKYSIQPKMEPDERKTTTPRLSEIQSAAEKAILDEYAPSGVLINENYEILHFVGITDRYLVPPIGKASFNILNMAREGLKNKLSILLHRAVREKKETSCKGIQISYNGGFCIIDLIVKPLTDKGLPHGFMLVVFEDKTPENISDERKIADSQGKEPDHAVESLEHELQSTREYLQATIEELETTNEELKSTNEELQSVNEELQSANEEMETSKEELQSTNEELATVNAELQHKVDELTRTSDDLNNLLAATEIASIFLDTNLLIKRYTPAAARIIKLIPTDIGRPINDLRTSFPDIDIGGQAENVLRNLNTIEVEIMSNNHTWYSMRIMPYMTIENVIDGAVMTFIDIHKVKQADKMRRFAAVLQDSNDAVMVQDFEGNILAWNKGAENLYGWAESEALTKKIYEMIPEEQQKEARSFIGRLRRGETTQSLRTQRRTKEGKNLNIWLTVTILTDDVGNPIEIATTERNLEWLPEA